MSPFRIGLVAAHLMWLGLLTVITALALPEPFIKILIVIGTFVTIFGVVGQAWAWIEDEFKRP